MNRIKGIRFTWNTQNTRSFGKFLVGNPTRPLSPIVPGRHDSSQVTPSMGIPFPDRVAFFSSNSPPKCCSSTLLLSRKTLLVVAPNDILMWLSVRNGLASVPSASGTLANRKCSSRPSKLKRNQSASLFSASTPINKEISFRCQPTAGSETSFPLITILSQSKAAVAGRYTYSTRLVDAACYRVRLTTNNTLVSVAFIQTYSSV